MEPLKVKEQDILNQIMDYLARKKVVHAHVRNTGAIFIRDGKTRFGRPKFHQKGVPDVLGCHNGKPIAIEVKSAVGKVSPEQLEWLRRWEDAGGYFIVSRNVQHVVDFIEAIERMK